MPLNDFPEKPERRTSFVVTGVLDGPQKPQQKRTAPDAGPYRLAQTAHTP